MTRHTARLMLSGVATATSVFALLTLPSPSPGHLPDEPEMGLPLPSQAGAGAPTNLHDVDIPLVVDDLAPLRFVRYPAWATAPAIPAEVDVWQTAGVSYYGQQFHGRTTANGERFDMAAMTCAHKTLDFGTMVMLRHDGRSAVCRVNDRGPFVGRREFDLSAGVFAQLAPLSAGVIEVEWQVME